MSTKPVSYRVWIPKAPADPFSETLRSNLDGKWQLFLGDAGNPESCDVLVAGRPTADQLGASVRSVVVPFAGIPAVTRELLLQHPDVSLHNLHHNAAPTAEMAIGLLLAVAKRVVPADQALRRDDWTMRYDHDNALLLAGRTAVIVGYGAIGRRVGAVCKAFGMNVLGVRRMAREGAEGLPVADLPELLPRADVLFLCVPATPESEGMIGMRELQQLPRSAIIVNVARGAVVDEAALFAALERRQLWGAGLDVWWRYPEDEEARAATAPAKHDFGSLDNVVLSPHRAGHGDKTERDRALALAELLNRGSESADLQLENRVSAERGY
ncbi:MAG: NAD(P)-dependent oxidoreductase [Planctomycetota bacterium]